VWTVDYSRLGTMAAASGTPWQAAYVLGAVKGLRCTSFGRSAIKSIWQFFALLHGNEVS